MGGPPPRRITPELFINYSRITPELSPPPGALWGLNGGPMGPYGGPLGPYGGPSGALRDSMGSYCTIFCPCKEHQPATIMVFYDILHYFTEKTIKYTFLPGFLPLQGTPTSENNEFYNILHYFSSFYRQIDKIGILARIFAPARHTHRRK